MSKEKTRQGRNRHSRKRSQKKSKFGLIFLLVVILLIIGGFLFKSYSDSQIRARKVAESISTSKSVSLSKSGSIKISESISQSKFENPTLPKNGAVLSYASDFPDPFILYANGEYYAYGTNVVGNILPMMSSKSLQNFQPIGSALSVRPSYAGFPSTTSPTVAKIGNQYILYSNVAISGSPKVYVIGAMTASSPTGPFVQSGGPLIGGDAGNADYFDPDVFMDGGKTWLAYATDFGLGNNIWLHQLTNDGLSLTGSKTTLLLDYTKVKDENGQPVIRVESPSLIKAADGTYVLFYAANDADQNNVYIGWATGKNLTSEFTDQGPLITSSTFGNSVTGPGEASLFTDPTGMYLAFNGWVGDHNGFNIISGGRYMYTLQFVWKDGHIPVFSKKVVS